MDEKQIKKVCTVLEDMKDWAEAYLHRNDDCKGTRNIVDLYLSSKGIKTSRPFERASAMEYELKRHFFTAVDVLNEVGIPTVFVETRLIWQHLRDKLGVDVKAMLEDERTKND